MAPVDEIGASDCGSEGSHAPGKARAYRSYLLRCWVAPGSKPAGRFVVEHASGEPGRRGFDTFAELVDFLRAELLGAAEEETAADGAPPSE